MELENTTRSEVTTPQRQVLHALSCLWILAEFSGVSRSPEVNAKAKEVKGAMGVGWEDTDFLI